MKFTCEKGWLASAVAIASRACAVKSPIPAMEGLLIEAGADIRITGYDLKKGIYTSFPADVAEAGSVVISSKLFGDIVRKLPNDLVTVSVSDKNMVRIICGNTDFSIIGSDAGDYPELPPMEYGSSLTLKQEVMSAMISETSFAISDNESRPVYTGALMEVEDKQLTMVAVDGYRLALRRELLEECSEEPFKFIVPGSSLSDLEKICVKPDENVTISAGSKHIFFSVGDTVLISRRLEGDFLNYRKTVPTSFPIKVAADRTELIRCADRVSVVIDDRAKHPLRCRFQDGTLNIRCSTPLGSAADTCAVDGNGSDLEIGFNNSYLLEALKAAPADRLQVNLGTGTSPCVLTAEDGSDRFLYMILPVRLRSES